MENNSPKPIPDNPKESLDDLKRQNIKTLPDIPLYDVRSELSESKKEYYKEVVRDAFSDIIHDGWNVSDEEIEIDGQPANELIVAGKIEDAKKRIGQLKSQDLPSDEVEAELHEFELLKRRVVARGMTERLLAQDNQELRDMAEEIIIAIQESLYKRGAVEPPGNGKHLVLYDERAITMLTYEIVYGDFLWRGKTRKDKVTSYYRSHCKAAVLKLVNSNFTDLKRILTELGHDNFEDLRLHRKDFGYPNVVPYDIKPDWTLCDYLYQHILDDETRPLLANIKDDVNKNIHALTKKRKKPEDKNNLEARREYDEWLLIDLYRKFLKNPYALLLKLVEQVQNSQTIANLPDARAKVKLALQILGHYAVMAKILKLDDIYKGLVAGGIDFHHPEMRHEFNKQQRQRIMNRLGLTGSTKSSIPERLFGLINLHDKIISADQIIYDFVNSVDKESDEVKGLQNTTKDRVLEALGIKDEDKAQSFIEAIKIIPKPLEDYVDPRRLSDPDYKLPEIPESDPMFEIVILAKNKSAIPTVASNVTMAIGADSIHIDNTPIPSDRPQKGIRMKFVDAALGGSIPVRVTTSIDEENCKRGLYADKQKPIPRFLRKRLLRAFKEIDLYLSKNYSPSEALSFIENTVLRDSITVTSGVGRRRMHRLSEGSTALDFIGRLPLPARDNALERATHAVLTRMQPGTGDERDYFIDLFTPLEDGDVCRIVMGDQATESRFDPGLNCFAAGTTFHAAHKNKVSREYKNHRQRDKHLCEIGSNYTSDLSRIFGINDLDTLPSVLSAACFDENYIGSLASRTAWAEDLAKSIDAYKQEEDPHNKKHLGEDIIRLYNLLSKPSKSSDKAIGSCDIDPLRLLALYLRRDRIIEIEVDLENHEYVHESLARIISSYGPSFFMRPTNPKASIYDQHGSHLIHIASPPDRISSYDILKMILQLKYYPFVKDIGLKPGSLVLPIEVEDLCVFEKNLKVPLLMAKVQCPELFE